MRTGEPENRDRSIFPRNVTGSVVISTLLFVAWHPDPKPVGRSFSANII